MTFWAIRISPLDENLDLTRTRRQLQTAAEPINRRLLRFLKATSYLSVIMTASCRVVLRRIPSSMSSYTTSGPSLECPESLLSIRGLNGLPCSFSLIFLTACFVMYFDRLESNLLDNHQDNKFQSLSTLRYSLGAS